MSTTRKRTAAQAATDDMFSYAPNPRNTPRSPAVPDTVVVPGGSPSSPTDAARSPSSPTDAARSPSPRVATYVARSPSPLVANVAQGPFDTDAVWIKSPSYVPDNSYVVNSPSNAGGYDPVNPGYGTLPPPPPPGRPPPVSHHYGDSRRPPQTYDRPPQTYDRNYGHSYGGERPSDSYQPQQQQRRRGGAPSRVGELQHVLAQVSKLIPERVWVEDFNMHPPIAIGCEQSYFDRWHQKRREQNRF
jgi:hypothetical protein